MGKRARLDRRSKRHIKVDDAADVVAALRLWAGGGGTRARGAMDARRDHSNDDPVGHQPSSSAR